MNLRELLQEVNLLKYASRRLSLDRSDWFVCDRNRHLNWKIESILEMDFSYKNRNHDIVI